MALPDARSDVPTVLPEAAILARLPADDPLHHPSGVKSDASDGARPDASVDAIQVLPAAGFHPGTDVDAGKSAVLEPVRAVAPVEPQDEPVPCKPAEVQSAEQSICGAVLRHVLPVRVALRLEPRAASANVRPVLPVSLRQAFRLEPQEPSAPLQRVLPQPELLQQEQASPPLEVSAVSALQLAAQRAFPPSTVESPRLRGAPRSVA
jgi:hypothetical protein